jgi:hypothetical protein
MYTINDPMFALILRFVGRNQKVILHDGNFIKKQLKEIQAHIDQFPAQEQESRALEWIEAHAYEYRKAWEKEAIGKEFSRERCPDCPFATMNDSEHCGIHEEWLSLLQRYAADEINSREYVENALNLIVRHKEDLKIKLSMLRKRAYE